MVQKIYRYKTIIKKLFKFYFPIGSFKKDVIILTLGTGFAQASLLIVSPILTRLYSPENFGTFAVFLSIVSVFVVISTGRYELAIVLPKYDKQAVNLLALSSLLVIILSFFILIFVIGLSFLPISFFEKIFSEHILYFIPIAILGIGLFNVITYWFNRKKRFNLVSFGRILNSGFIILITILVGIVKIKSYGLILGYISGYIITVLFMWFRFFKEYSKILRYISCKLIKLNAKKYANFPKYNSLQAFVDMLQSAITALLISLFFGESILGFYALTLRVLKSPVSLIGSSISQVFFQRASEVFNKNEDLYGLIKKVITKLFLISLPFFIVILIFGSNIFSVVFGENWKTAGLYAQILTPWIFFNFLVSPISQVPLILGKQKEVFLISLVGNLIIISCILFAGYIANDIIIGFYILSTLMSIYYLFVIWWIFIICKRKY